MPCKKKIKYWEKCQRNKYLNLSAKKNANRTLSKPKVWNNNVSS